MPDGKLKEVRELSRDDFANLLKSAKTEDMMKTVTAGGITVSKMMADITIQYNKAAVEVGIKGDCIDSAGMLILLGDKYEKVPEGFRTGYVGYANHETNETGNVTGGRIRYKHAGEAKKRLEAWKRVAEKNEGITVSEDGKTVHIAEGDITISLEGKDLVYKAGKPGELTKVEEKPEIEEVKAVPYEEMGRELKKEFDELQQNVTKDLNGIIEGEGVYIEEGITAYDLAKSNMNQYLESIKKSSDPLSLATALDKSLEGLSKQEEIRGYDDCMHLIADYHRGLNSIIEEERLKKKKEEEERPVA